MDSSAVGSLKRVLAFPFRQAGWQGRFFIGSALILVSFIIPLLPALFAAGYVLIILRQVIEGHEPSLPEWQDWGRLLGDGFKSWLVSFVYLLPATLAFVIGFVAYFASVFAGIAAGDPGGPAFGEAYFLALLVGLLVLFLSMFVGSLLAVLGWIPLPLALGNLASRERIRNAFHLQDITRRLSADPGGYLAAWVVVAGLSALLYVAAMLAYYTFVLMCFVPLLSAPVCFYILLVGAALFGQAYREAAARLETAPPLAD
jgi:MFS family permease